MTIKLSKFITVALVTCIAFFILSYLILRLFFLRPLNVHFEEGQKTLENLKKKQADQSELLSQIDQYRNGLYALNLVLEGRKNVLNGNDEQNPYLVYDFTQVLNDLRRLLPHDARATQFQVNAKGLVTLPIESVDYASLGRVLKSFKDKSQFSLEDPDGPKLFTEVKVPAGAQRTVRQIGTGKSNQFEQVYSLLIQAQLNPEFWQNPMPFLDVDSLAYYAQAIRDLNLAGSIQGYSDRNFKPDQAIVWSEFFKLALFESPSHQDVDLGGYKNYIDLSGKEFFKLAKQIGIETIETDSKPDADRKLNRAEGLRMLLTVFQVPVPSLKEYEADLKKGETLKPLSYANLQPSHKDYPVFKVALEQGLLEGGDSLLKPEQSLSRAEAVYWVWKLKTNTL